MRQATAHVSDGRQGVNGRRVFVLIIGAASSVPLIRPGIVPYMLGTFRFDTLVQRAFALSPIIPSTATRFSVTVALRSGMNSGEDVVNLWLWTECLLTPFQDIRFKRAYRYNQAAYSFDSETFEFVHCPSNSKLFVITDNRANNVLLELFAVGYSLP